MCADFAASRGFLRPFFKGLGVSRPQDAARVVRSDLPEATDPLLDRFVPALVVTFLLIAGYSMLAQYTTSRRDMLISSEQALAVAAQMFVADAAARHHNGGEAADTVLTVLPAADLPGRAFLVAGRDGRIQRSSRPEIIPGRLASGLFAPNEDVLAPRALGEMRHVALADGRIASLITREIITGQTLIAYQPVEDELTNWQQHASVVSALLLAFGAVTIAFCLLPRLLQATLPRAGHRAERAAPLQSLRGRPGSRECRTVGLPRGRNPPLAVELDVPAAGS